jgi:hypothetical protein
MVWHAAMEVAFSAADQCPGTCLGPVGSTPVQTAILHGKVYLAQSRGCLHCCRQSVQTRHMVVKTVGPLLAAACVKVPSGSQVAAQQGGKLKFSTPSLHVVVAGVADMEQSPGSPSGFCRPVSPYPHSATWQGASRDPWCLRWTSQLFQGHPCHGPPWYICQQVDGFCTFFRCEQRRGGNVP